MCTVSVVSNGTISKEEGYIKLKTDMTAAACKELCEFTLTCKEASFSHEFGICLLYNKEVSFEESAGEGSFHYRKSCSHGKLCLKHYRGELTWIVMLFDKFMMYVDIEL